MKKNLVIGLLILSVSNIVSAGLTIDQIGDADGFGIGASSGESFDWTTVGIGDGDGTDQWGLGDRNIFHTYDISGLGTITSASLEIFTGGQGLEGLTSLYLDGSFVGHLTDGDDVGPGYNYAWLDTFNLLSFADLLNGSNELTIDVAGGSDGWILDYSRLTISDEITSVPEPSVIALLLSGLAAVFFAQRGSRASSRELFVPNKSINYAPKAPDAAKLRRLLRRYRA